MATRKRKPTRGMVKIMGHTVREGTKKHAILVQQKRIWDDLGRYEVDTPKRENPGRRALIPAKVLIGPTGKLRVFVSAKAAARLKNKNK